MCYITCQVTENWIISFRKGHCYMKKIQIEILINISRGVTCLKPALYSLPSFLQCLLLCHFTISLFLDLLALQSCK